MIKAKEVICNIPVDNGQDFDFNLLCPHIEVAEERHILPCLGADFLSDLEADIDPDFYLLFDDANLFKYNLQYTATQHVIWKNKLYECILNTTIGIEPSNVTYWTEVPKFLTSANNDLWYNYLLKVYSYAVMNVATPFVGLRFTNTGIMRNNTDYSQPVSSAELSILANAQTKSFEDILARMIRFLKGNTDFPLFLGNQTECGVDNDCKRRNNGFAFSYIVKSTSNDNGCC